MYLLDTNICAYLMRGRYPSLNTKILTIPPSELAISSITLFELEFGAAKANWGPRRLEDMRLFLAAFQVIPFTEYDAVVTGRIRAVLVKEGLPIGSYDIQIAGQGVADDHKLVLFIYACNYTHIIKKSKTKTRD